MIVFDCRLERPDFTFEAAFEAGLGITALFGPSGSGKSTAIRLIAGLEQPTRGRIVVAGETLLDTAAGVAVPPHRRGVGLVFQDALLFPHLSVKANLTYGRWFTPRARRRIGFAPVVEVLGIGHLLDRRPATLSGGERQRVAIGRALLTTPRLLLMDEPLASLDAARKLDLLPFIERLRDEFAIPIIYVSHAVEEVARLAAQVVRLEDGRVAACGTPSQVLTPARVAAGIARFAAISFLTGRAAKPLPDFGVTVLDHPAGEIIVAGVIAGEGPVRVAVRATDVALALGRPRQVSVRTQLAGRILSLDRGDGPLALAVVELTGGERLAAYVTRLAADDLGLDAGDHVTALVKTVAIDEGAVAGPVPDQG